MAKKKKAGEAKRRGGRPAAVSRPPTPPPGGSDGVESDLNNLFDAVNIPIVILSSDLRVRRFTPVAAKVFRLLPADVGRSITAIRGDVEIPDLEQLCAEVIETTAPAVREVRDREGGWHTVRIRPYRTPDNTIDGVVLTAIDITAVKTSLEEAAAARDYAEAIVDTTRTPLLVLDPNFRIRSANPAFYETFQVSAEQTVNRLLFDLGSGQWDIPGLHGLLDALLAHDTPFENFEVEHEFPSIGARVMLLSARQIHRQSEAIRSILLAVDDITVRRQAERELRASEEVRYRRLFETAMEGILLMDADSGQVTTVNPAWTSLTGRSADAVVGRKLWELQAFEDADKVRAILRELQTREVVRYEDVVLTRADGTQRHVELACNGYLLGGRKVVQCIVRDITERVELLRRERMLRLEAEAANRAKDDFLSVLSHELRTPLTAMLGWVRVLRRGAMDPAKTADALETVERNTRLLAQLIEDLLDVSRIASGKLAIDVRDVDLTTVVRAAVETVRQSADVKHLELRVDVPDAPPIVRGDRHRLQQVVWNLLSNAVKFTPKGGRVDAKLEAISAGARITVSDSGRGISPEFLPQIFDRFRQAEGVSTRTQGGLGLGLAIVRHLVELHGGRVAAFSAGEGRGAMFTVELPVGAATSAQREDEARSAARRPSGDARLDGLRVLVVEDEVDTGRLLSQILGDRGADVVPVETTAAALAAMTQHRIQVIVSDIGLPGADGYELIRRLRGLPAGEGGRIPAIALTAFARDEDRHRAIDAGFDAHLAKPIDPAELARIIAQLANR